jgi:hypothetical protein
LAAPAAVAAPLCAAPADLYIEPLDALARARRRGPLRLALARVAARIVATRSWERLGFARLADYARERAGLSARQIQDLAHTSARLVALPALEDALASGRLGWSQARLVARVATREDEARWGAFARRVTVRELEHAVRAIDRGSLEGGGLEMDEDGESAGFKVGIVVRCTRSAQGKFHAVRVLARRVAGEPLPTWACMEAVAAEALSALPLGLAGEGEVMCAAPARVERRRAAVPQEVALEDEPIPPYDPEVASMCADTVPEGTASLLQDLDAADAFELDARLRRAVAQEQRLDAELAPLLAIFPAEALGISPRKARALRRIQRVAARCPELREAFRSGRLSWVQAQAIAPVASASWVEHAARVSVRRLYEDVDRALYGSEPPRQTCAQPTGAEAIPHEPETSRFFFSAPADVARLFRAVVCSVRRCLGGGASEGAAVDWMFEHAHASWSVDVPREHRVFQRDGWRCTVPGCSSYRNLHDHHIVFRSAGGSDELANRTTLCAFHHLRGVHAGRVGCRGSAPGGLAFELGLRPGREPLLRYAPGERVNARSASPGAGSARP